MDGVGTASLRQGPTSAGRAHWPSRCTRPFPQRARRGARLTELDICERVLTEVDGRADALVHVATAQNGLTRFANSFIHQNVAEDLVTVSLRATVDGRSASASTTDTSDDGVRGLVSRTVEAARLRPPDPHWPGLAPPAEIPSIEHWDDGAATAEPAARAERVKAFNDATGGLETAGYCATEG